MVVSSHGGATLGVRHVICASSKGVDVTHCIEVGVGRTALMFVAGIGSIEQVAGAGIAFDVATVAVAVEVMAAGVIH